MLDVRIQGANKLREMAIQLRKADKEYLGRELGKAIRKAGEKTVKDVRRSAERIQTTGVRKPDAKRPFLRVVPPKGTRAKIAATVGMRVSVLSDNPRVQFRAGAGLPAEIAMMPRKFDGQTWRHPVMGNRDAWVSQRSKTWFFPPIKDNLDTFRAEIDVALDKTREMLERG